MTTNKISESGIIDKLTSVFSGEGFIDSFTEHDCKGIGDDCAVIGTGDNSAMVVTTDMLVEDVHFVREAISAGQLGHKSLAVNLSDVAAMGAAPFASFMSISLPKDLDSSWALDFIEGYKSLSQQHNVLLLGGDTVGGDKIVINVVAVGKLNKENIKYRTTAQEHDCILVTGSLGESAAGLEIILSKLEDKEDWSTEEQRLVDMHHTPTPQIESGVWLGKQAAVNAMVDISDGLLNDIKHITKTFGAKIDASRIPTSVDVVTAISGGEDYQLLVTVKKEQCKQLMQDYLTTFGKPLYKIGHISSEAGVEWLGLEPSQLERLKTFSHF
ncbi:MAG: thiamine-phosphate kinase [Rikenellaceae bacterium]